MMVGRPLRCRPRGHFSAAARPAPGIFGHSGRSLADYSPHTDTHKHLQTAVCCPRPVLRATLWVETGTTRLATRRWRQRERGLAFCPRLLGDPAARERCWQRFFAGPCILVPQQPNSPIGDIRHTMRRLGPSDRPPYSQAWCCPWVNYCTLARHLIHLPCTKTASGKWSLRGRSHLVRGHTVLQSADASALAAMPDPRRRCFVRCPSIPVAILASSWPTSAFGLTEGSSRIGRCCIQV